LKQAKRYIRRLGFPHISCFFSSRKHVLFFSQLKTTTLFQDTANMHFTSLFVAASAFVTALAAPVAEPVENGLASLVERSTPAGTGQNNGYYYSFWNAGKSISTPSNPGHALTTKRWRYCQLQQQGCW
jgi:hypothetical protein